MSLLGSALLCAPQPNRCLYVITCPDYVKVNLLTLLSGALGELYKKGDLKFLSKTRIYPSDFEPMKDNRMVVFDTSQMSCNVSRELFKAYFDCNNNIMVGGKHYFFNTSFLFIDEAFPPITTDILHDYKNIYYLHLDNLLVDDIEDLSNLYQPFFISLITAANNYYNQLQQSEVTLPTIPLSLGVSNRQAKANIKKADAAVKIPSNKKLGKQLFSQFIDRRVIIGDGHQQPASEFQRNFDIFMQEQQVTDVTITDAVLGKYLVAWFKATRDNFDIARPVEGGKKVRNYVGLTSYDYDVK